MLEKYVREVGNNLRIAHNAKDMTAIQTAFQSADTMLNINNFTKDDKKIFWSSVRKAMYESGTWLVEEQAHNSLLVLMQEIQKGLVAREGK